MSNLPPLNFQPTASNSAPANPVSPANPASPLNPAASAAPPAQSAQSAQAAHDARSTTVLSLTIKSKSALFAAFMPLLNNAGLFIPTGKRYNIGDEVLVLLALMDLPEKISFSGTVAWVTPPGAQNSKVQGIGVHFKNDKAGTDVKQKIESILGNLVNSSRPTHTI